MSTLWVEAGLLVQMVDMDLNDAAEKKVVEGVFWNAVDILSEQDRRLPHIHAILPMLKRGVGVHHSGLLPILKEVIEILFQEGLIKVGQPTTSLPPSSPLPPHRLQPPTVCNPPPRLHVPHASSCLLILSSPKAAAAWGNSSYQLWLFCCRAEQIWVGTIQLAAAVAYERNTSSDEGISSKKQSKDVADLCRPLP